MEDGPASIFSQASRSKKYLATFGIIYCGFALGICLTFLNSTMIDFGNKLGETVEVVSKVFSVATAAYLVGALSSGIVPNYIARQLWVMFLLVAMALPLFFMPYVESVMMLYVLTAVVGIGCGGFDAAQSAWLIDIWRHEAPPFLLMEHFAYAVGALVPPLIQGPYLTEEDEDPPEDNKKGTTTSVSSSTDLPYEYRLQTPFIIGGFIALFAVVIQTCVYIFAFRAARSGRDNQKAHDELKVKENSDAKTAGSDNLKRTLLLVGLSCCVIGFYSGVEMCSGQFISTFSSFSNGLSSKESSRIVFGLQLGFAIGRFCGIFLVLKVAPQLLLVGNFVLLLASNVILLVLARSSITWLWVGSVMLGLGMSTVFGGLYAHIEKYIFVTDRIASSMAVTAGGISIIYPIIVGKWIEDNPEVLTYVNFLSIFVCVVSFSVLFYNTHVKASRERKAADGE